MEGDRFNELERDAGGKPISTFPYPALAPRRPKSLKIITLRQIGGLPESPGSLICGRPALRVPATRFARCRMAIRLDAEKARKKRGL
jgi:hypothetical protein